MAEKKIKTIAEELKATEEQGLPAFIAEYLSDERNGVQKLVKTAQNRLKKLQEERMRLEKMRIYERQNDNYLFICGVDEAGRGPLAGPVAAGAVILPKDCEILYLNDSKKLSESRREELYLEIQEKAVAWAVGLSGPQRIDEINILQATYEAMRSAIGQLSPAPDLLLNDAVRIPNLAIEQRPIIKGDAKSLSIAAASVMAKVTRDHIMYEYDKIYPEYGFAKNKGYGTADHIEALKKFGPTPIHRRSFIGHFVGEENKTKELPQGENKSALGRKMEEKAAFYLAEKGFQILEHNFKCDMGEIDLIAEERGSLVFAEVKYRASLGQGDPSEAVDINKQKRISKASDYYRLIHHIPENMPIRYDVIAMTDSEIRHIVNAFDYRGLQS
jgi:ribonuclease HII